MEKANVLRDFRQNISWSDMEIIAISVASSSIWNETWIELKQFESLTSLCKYHHTSFQTNIYTYQIPSSS